MGQRRDTQSRPDQGGHAVNPDQPAVQHGSLHAQRRHNHRQLQKTDAGSVALRVTDTGIGIAAEDIPKVLEPFGQVRHDSPRSHGGTDLGLTLSKHLTEMHGDTLEIEAPPEWERQLL
ncbi:MAG: ATP-binding protein [Alphaproteobacteria bacterium]